MNDYNEIFYLSPATLCSSVGSSLNARFSIFKNEIETLIPEHRYTHDGQFLSEYKIKKLESTFYYEKNYADYNGSFIQIFKKNNEFYLRFIVEYSCLPRSMFCQNKSDIIHMGYTDKLDNIKYGSLIDKINKIYTKYWFHPRDVDDAESIKEYLKVEGSFSIGMYANIIYQEVNNDFNNFQLKDTNDVVIIYFGRDKDYYFASTDLKIHNNYFCIEAISNNNDKVILKTDIISKYIMTNDRSQEIFLDKDSELDPSAGLFNHNLIAEKLEKSDIAIEDFTLQFDVERMAKINNLLQKDRIVIDNGWSSYRWNIDRSQNIDSVDPIEEIFDTWRDALHENGLDENDLV